MKVIDLFAGCGGLSLGLINAGFEIVSAYDNWEPAINVYKQNFNHSIYNIDLGNIDNLEIMKMKKINSDVIVGGPPCQDFSSAGKRDTTLGRADLTVNFAEIISKIKPNYFIMENVSLINKAFVLSKAKEIYKNEGYGLTEVVLDASYYGVPQSRKRYFLLGERFGQDGAMEFYLNEGASENKMTVRDYLGDSLGVEFYYRHPRSYNRRAIFSIDEPSPTVRGVNRPIPPNYKMHPGDKSEVNENVRPLTTIERSYIQTFPKTFIFEGTKTDLEQMIGNAVPVNLATHVGKALLKYIDYKNSNATSNNIK